MGPRARSSLQVLDVRRVLWHDHEASVAFAFEIAERSDAVESLELLWL